MDRRRFNFDPLGLCARLVIGLSPNRRGAFKIA